METAISIKNISKTYAGGHAALKDVTLDIYKGEIFALLGSNGAGKTTLISLVCGLLNITNGKVSVFGHDNITEYKQSRSKIGLVPQELTLDAFETVYGTVSLSRGVFGKLPSKEYIQQLLRDLSLYDKKDSELRELSGGMKRRVLIAKALAHEPEILFLDEPTAGVDVELRREMWQIVRKLQEKGVTIILTTHYLEEAEEMADRIGIISKGKLLTVQNKTDLMQEFGKKELTVFFNKPLTSLPPTLQNNEHIQQSEDKLSMTYSYETRTAKSGIGDFVKKLNEAGIAIADLETKQASLEDIFINITSK